MRDEWDCCQCTKSSCRMEDSKFTVRSSETMGVYRDEITSAGEFQFPIEAGAYVIWIILSQWSSFIHAPHFHPTYTRIQPTI
jgi:hypothetical protein